MRYALETAAIGAAIAASLTALTTLPLIAGWI
jgi:hypothetical protein